MWRLVDFGAHLAATLILIDMSFAVDHTLLRIGVGIVAFGSAPLTVLSFVRLVYTVRELNFANPS